MTAARALHHVAAPARAGARTTPDTPAARKVDRRTFLITAAAASMGAPSLAQAAPASGNASAAEIAIGQSAVLSGPLSPPALVLQSGVRLAFEEANGQGGIGGRKLRLISLDDAFDAERALANYRTLVGKENVLACIAGVGAIATTAGLPLLREAGVPLVGATAVVDSVRAKSEGVAYYTRATQMREAEVLVQHLATLGQNRIAVAHLGTPGGLEVLSQIRTVGEKYQVQIAGSTAIAPDGSNLAAAAREVAALQAHAVILFLTAAHAPALIKAVTAAGSVPSYYGMSILAGDVTAKLLGDQYRGLAISAVTPYPWDGANADAQQFRRAAEQAKVPVGYHSYEGYIAARALIQAIRQTGGELSRARLHTSLSRLRMRFATMDIDFNGDRGTGTRFVELVRARADGRYVR